MSDKMWIQIGDRIPNMPVEYDEMRQHIPEGAIILLGGHGIPSGQGLLIRDHVLIGALPITSDMRLAQEISSELHEIARTADAMMINIKDYNPEIAAQAKFPLTLN